MSRGAAIACFACLILLGLALMNWRPVRYVPSPPDTVYTRIMERSKAVAETTIVRVARIDTLLQQQPGDTVFLTRTQWDTVRLTCLACARQLDSLRRYVDSARKKDADSIARLTVALSKCKGSRPWYAVVGLGIGAASCRVP